MKPNNLQWLVKVGISNTPAFYRAMLIYSSFRLPIQTNEGIIHCSFGTVGYALATNYKNQFRVKNLSEVNKIINKHAQVKVWVQNNLKNYYELIPQRSRESFIKGFTLGIVYKYS